MVLLEKVCERLVGNGEAGTGCSVITMTKSSDTQLFHAQSPRPSHARMVRSNGLSHHRSMSSMATKGSG